MNAVLPKRSNLNRPSIGATVTPDSPSAPPVSQLALFAISYTIEVIASVSIRSVSAFVRRITAPVAMPSSAAAAAAASNCRKGSVSPYFALSTPAV